MPGGIPKTTRVAGVNKNVQGSKAEHQRMGRITEDDDKHENSLYSFLQEEIIEDEHPLPCFNGRVVSWLVSADTSVLSDTGK